MVVFSACVSKKTLPTVQCVFRFIAARGDDFIHQSHADALLKIYAFKKHGHVFARGVLLYAYARALCGFNGNSMKTISALAKERLFEAYQGEKELYLTDGDHHSARTLACRLDSVWMPGIFGPRLHFPPGRMRHSSYAEPSIHRIWLGPQAKQT